MMGELFKEKEEEAYNRFISIKDKIIEFLKTRGFKERLEIENYCTAYSVWYGDIKKLESSTKLSKVFKELYEYIETVRKEVENTFNVKLLVAFPDFKEEKKRNIKLIVTQDLELYIIAEMLFCVEIPEIAKDVAFPLPILYFIRPL